MSKIEEVRYDEITGEKYTVLVDGPTQQELDIEGALKRLLFGGEDWNVFVEELRRAQGGENTPWKLPKKQGR